MGGKGPFGLPGIVMLTAALLLFPAGSALGAEPGSAVPEGTMDIFRVGAAASPLACGEEPAGPGSRLFAPVAGGEEAKTCAEQDPDAVLPDETDWHRAAD